MGREGAALALAIVSAKPMKHFTRGPGGYFGGMVRKAQKGELYLEKTLWALREGNGARDSAAPSIDALRIRTAANG